MRRGQRGEIALRSEVQTALRVSSFREADLDVVHGNREKESGSQREGTPLPGGILCCATSQEEAPAAVLACRGRNQIEGSN